MKKLFFIFLLISVVIIAGCSSLNTGANKETEEKTSVTVFKSAACGCCALYVSELKRRGFDVEVLNTENMDSVKDRYDIPSNMRSCHTSIIGDYFVEGHIPIEAINKLLVEKPEIRGIAMPGMPSGSPGMSGAKKTDFVIQAIEPEGNYEFMRV